MLVPPGDKFLDLKSPCFRFISYQLGVNFGLRRRLWGPIIVRLPLLISLLSSSVLVSRDGNKKVVIIDL